MKYISSILLIALVSTLTITGTWAWFSDTETSGVNTLNMGTLDLYLTDGNPTPNAQWTLFRGAPGDQCKGGHLRMYNIGNLEANHIDIGFNLDKYEDEDGDPANGYARGPESDTNLAGVGNMAEALVVDRMYYEVYVGGTRVYQKDLVWYSSGNYQFDQNLLSDENDNNYIDLDDLEKMTEKKGKALDNLPVPKAIDSDSPNNNDYADLIISISQWGTLGQPQNDYQGDVIDMTVEVTLNQDISQ